MRARSGTMPSSSSSKIVRRYISVVSIRSLTRPSVRCRPPCMPPAPGATARHCRSPRGRRRPRRYGPACVADTVLWFRRDLRLGDHPALLAAAERAAPAGVVAAVRRRPGALGAGRAAAAGVAAAVAARARRAPATDGRAGRPARRPRATWCPRLAARGGRRRVHVTRGRRTVRPPPRRRRRGRARPRRPPLVRTGTPYAVGPGHRRTADGTPYQVFTPVPARLARPRLAGARRRAAGRAPAAGSRRRRRASRCPPEPDLGGLTLPEAGEAAALARWQAFLDGALAGYDESARPAGPRTGRRRCRRT